MRLVDAEGGQGGIVPIEDALRQAQALNLDLVEVAPPFDVGGLTAFNGASVLFEILCLLTEAWEARRTPR